MNKKLLHLESVRGIAAISVAIFHFRTGSILEIDFIRNSWLMVDFFFVLSGFVIALNYQNKLHTFKDLINFQKKRFLRLYPLHLLTLFVFVGIEILKYLVEIKLSIVANHPAFSSNNFEAFFQNFFLLQNILGNSLTFNYPSWSISAEFYTYLIFASFTLILQKFLKLKYLFFVLIISFSIYQLVQNGMKAEETGIYRCIYSFFLGTLLYELHKFNKFKVNTLVSSLCVLSSIIAVSFAGIMSDIQLMMFPFLFSAIIFSLNNMPQKSAMIRVLSHKWLVYLGTISFGIYMIHASVFWGITQTLKFVFKVRTINIEGKFELDFDNPILAAVIQLFALAIVCILAHFSYKYFEKPIIEKFKPLPK